MVWECRFLGRSVRNKPINVGEVFFTLLFIEQRQYILSILMHLLGRYLLPWIDKGFVITGKDSLGRELELSMMKI